jgi:hypothetical protein
MYRCCKALAGLFMSQCVLAMMPLACGGAGEDYVMTNPSSRLPSALETNDWSAPELITEQMKGCVQKHARDLNGANHEARFQGRLTKEETVKEIKLQRSTFRHDELASCLQAVLAGMSIPLSALPLRSSEPFSGGESSNNGRAYQGVVQAAAPVVVIAPIILMAAGVTLAVYVAAVATEEAIEAVKRRRKDNAMCMAAYDVCRSYNRQPDWNIDTFGQFKDCESCLGECKRHGAWPEYKCPLLTTRGPPGSSN